MGQRLVINITKNGKRLANAYYHWSGYTESAIYLMNLVIEYIQNNPLSEDVYSSREFKKLALNALRNTGAKAIESPYVISDKDVSYINNNLDFFGIQKNSFKTEEELKKVYKEGGILYEDALKEIQEKGEFIDSYSEEGSIDRNNGLICITDGGMSDNEQWAESICSYDIKTKRIYFGALHIIDDLKDYEVISETDESIKIRNKEWDSTYNYDKVGFNFDVYNMTVEEFGVFCDFVEEGGSDFYLNNTFYEIIG